MSRVTNRRLGGPASSQRGNRLILQVLSACFDARGEFLEGLRERPPQGSVCRGSCSSGVVDGPSKTPFPSHLADLVIAVPYKATARDDDSLSVVCCRCCSRESRRGIAMRDKHSGVKRWLFNFQQRTICLGGGISAGAVRTIRRPERRGTGIVQTASRERSCAAALRTARSI